MTKEKVTLKQVLVEVVNGNNEASTKIVHFSDVTKGKHIKRITYYLDPALHNLYLDCLNRYSKLGKDEVESLFEVGLHTFIYKVIKEKNPQKAFTQSNGNLFKWARKHIKGMIVEELNNKYGKVSIDQTTGEKQHLDIEIVPEQIAFNNTNSGDDEDTSDLDSHYSLASFQKWNQNNLYISFSDFIKEMNLDFYITELLTKQQLAIYPKLVKKYQVENQKAYGNSHIARELNIDESRVRKLEEIIGNKLYKVYQLWITSKKNKHVPLSHEIRDFLTMYGYIIDTMDDVNGLFEMLVSWLKMQIDKEKQVNINYLFMNKVEHEQGIIDLIMDGDSELKEVIIRLDKGLHKSTYMTLCEIIEGKIDRSNLRKETKETIIKKCLNIFYTYLQNLNKELNKIVQYVSTYEKRDEVKSHYKGVTDQEVFNKKVDII